MRGSISNDGFSEALSQEEEDRPQAVLCINRLGGDQYYKVFAIYFQRPIPRGKRRLVPQRYLRSGSQVPHQQQFCSNNSDLERTGHELFSLSLPDRETAQNR